MPTSGRVTAKQLPAERPAPGLIVPLRARCTTMLSHPTFCNAVPSSFQSFHFSLGYPCHRLPVPKAVCLKLELYLFLAWGGQWICRNLMCLYFTQPCYAGQWPSSDQTRVRYSSCCQGNTLRAVKQGDRQCYPSGSPCSTWGKEIPATQAGLSALLCYTSACQSKKSLLWFLS